MRRIAWLGGIALVGACRRTPPPPAPAADAGALVVAEPPSIPRTPEPEVPADAGKLVKAAPPLPLASDELELVAVGSRWGSKLISFQVLGSRVWISAVNFDASADGDGPLAKSPDPLAKLPYDPKKHRVQVVGKAPNLFALRMKDVNNRMESPEPVVFVLRDGAWVQSKPLKHPFFPHAFVAWNDGALVVHSQIELNAQPYFQADQPGTTFEYVGPDAATTDPKLAIDRRFMAWGGESDGTTLSLIGTVAPANPKAWDDPPPKGSIVVVRGTPKEGFTTATLMKGVGLGMESYTSSATETGDAALAFIGMTTIEDTWKPSSPTLFVVSGGKALPRVIPMPDEFCGTQSVAQIDGAIYAVRSCVDPAHPPSLVRIPEDGRATQLRMPMLVRADAGGFRAAKTGEKGAIGCAPKRLLRRAPNDLWVESTCGGTGEGTIVAILRRGRPQEPVIIP